MRKGSRLRIVIAIILSVCLGLSFTACLSKKNTTKKSKNNSTSSASPSGIDDSKYHGSLDELGPLSAKSVLSDPEKNIYDNLCTIIEKFETTYDFSENLSVDSLKKIVSAIQDDKPEFFWLETYIWSTTDEKLTSIEFSYNCSSITQKQSKQANIDSYISEFLSGINSNMNAYEKVKYTHDYLIKNTDYLIDAQDSQNICSVFINGKTVCAGYAKSTQYLLKKLGIRCAYVSGEAIGRGSHAWNMIELDGDYYYLDVTWDDPAFGGGQLQDYIGYNYFCITTDELKRTHSLSENLIDFPVCTATKDNYFVKENLIFNGINGSELQRLKDKINESVAAGNKFFASKFTSPQLARDAVDEITRMENFIGKSVKYTIDEKYSTLVLFL
ncbi:MAG: transglutaminase domain-containing protein [Bacillota bacterium]